MVFNHTILLAPRPPRFVSPTWHAAPAPNASNDTMTTVQTPKSAKSQSNTTPASGQHSAVQRKSDPHSPGLTLRLEQGKDVVDPDGALDVSDDRT